MIALGLALRVNLRTISRAVWIGRRKSHSISRARNAVPHFNHAGLVIGQWLGELHGQIFSVAKKFRRGAIQFHRCNLQAIGVQHETFHGHSNGAHGVSRNRIRFWRHHIREAQGNLHVLVIHHWARRPVA